uniref:Uncharacterized protein n=1 Tax=Candidatus Methanogaster sp. ANME-2c ERB4 TaxID=2759911 RepID=A0A7G9YQP6_9EURY|nr:hypothetical protein DDMMJHKH_00003 [Methanosarcinales archaeon ANME-2c ERB4]
MPLPPFINILLSVRALLLLELIKTMPVPSFELMVLFVSVLLLDLSKWMPLLLFNTPLFAMLHSSIPLPRYIPDAPVASFTTNPLIFTLSTVTSKTWSFEFAASTVTTSALSPCSVSRLFTFTFSL